MLQNLDSDKKIKMVASDAFENLLKQVQSSNLNFRMEISPFSAVITLKKSLLKDKSGQILFPPISESVQLQQSQDDQNCLLQKMKHLENIIEAQKSDYINALIQCKTAARHEFENEAVVGGRVGVRWVESIALGIVWLWSSRLSLLRYFCRMLQRLLV